jgi:hypothetical protein
MSSTSAAITTKIQYQPQSKNGWGQTAKEREKKISVEINQQLLKIISIRYEKNVGCTEELVMEFQCSFVCEFSVVAGINFDVGYFCFQIFLLIIVR